MNLTLFDFGLDPNNFFWVGIIGLIASVGIVIYFVVYRPKRSRVFAEEQSCGPWTVPQMGLGRTAEGEVCTARHHYEALFSSMITNAAKIAPGTAAGDDKTVTRLCNLRDKVLESFLFAQRSQYGDILYLFDRDPQDPKYQTAIGDHRFISNVQDCQSNGEDDSGMEIVSVKLSPETAKYTPEERAEYSQREEALKFVKVAASNSDRIAHLEERLANDELVKGHLYGELRKAKTGEDTANTAAGIVPLATPGPPGPRPSMFGNIGRKFFSKSQLIVGGISFVSWLALTNLLKGFGVVVPDPNTIGVLVAVAIFFGVPIIRGWFNK